MFRKKIIFTPLKQEDHLFDELDRRPLNEVIDDIEKELKDSTCAISRGLPIVPIKAREAKMDGRLFTTDVYDIVNLLKHLSNSSVDPVNRQARYISDLQNHFVVMHEVIEKIDSILERNLYTRDELLKEFGISRELYEYLINRTIPKRLTARRVHYDPAAGESSVDILCDKFICYLLGSLLAAFSLAALVIIWSERDKIFTIETVDTVSNSIANVTNALIEVFPKVFEILFYELPSSLLKGLLNGISYLLNSINNLEYSHLQKIFQFAYDATGFTVKTIDFIKVPALTIASTALVTREAYQIQTTKKSWSDSSDNYKLFMLSVSFGILLLGMDALTDCLGLVTSMTPDVMDKEIVGLAPLMTVGVASLFGIFNRKTKAEIDFEELEEKNFEYGKKAH